MSQVLNTFLEWFEQLTPSEQAEIAHFICTPTSILSSLWGTTLPILKLE